MAKTISDLTAVTSLDDADLFEIEQGGVSKKMTKAQLRTLLFNNALELDDTILPIQGDVSAYDGTNWVASAKPRWRVIPQEAYTESAVASSSTITFAGGGPTDNIYLGADDYFEVGMPVRVVISGTTYYGIAVTVAETLLTIAGAILPTGTAITSVSVGSKDMVKRVSMGFAGTTYNGSSTLILTKGCQHYWMGGTGYLCRYTVMHMNTSSTTEVTLQMNGGSDVIATGVIPGAGTSTTYGAATASGNGTLIAANLAISNGELVTAKTPTVGGTADYLIIDMLFVIP